MITMTLCAIATIAFFLPILAERDQNFADNQVFLVLDIAQATSHRAAFM
jgi:hypothetical protein